MTTHWIHCGPSDACSESAKCLEWCLDRKRSLPLWENCEIAGTFDNSGDYMLKSKGTLAALYISMTLDYIVHTDLNTLYPFEKAKVMVALDN